MNKSSKNVNSLIKSERSIGILSKVGKNSVILRNSLKERREIQERQSQDSEERSSRKDASLLERQLSLPCSNFNLEPIALFENVNIQKSRPYSGPRIQREKKTLNEEKEKAKEHNYSEIKMNYNLRGKKKIAASPKVAQFHNYAYPSSSNQEKSFTPVTNINDLKKITPRVKVLNQETPTLQAIKKIITPPAKKSSPEKMLFEKENDLEIIIDEETKNKMRKYCRTCAEMKYPLVDIFSEKGIQMRLNLQIKHLQQIRDTDSLSTQMCMDCICDLKMSFTFFVQIKKAEMKLRAIQTKFLEDGKEINNDDNDDDDEKILPLIQHDVANLKNNGPRIAAVFSTNPVDWEAKKVGAKGTTKEMKEMKEANEERNQKVKIKTEKIVHNETDNESIEEFDPEDHLFHPESDSEEEPKKTNPFQKTLDKVDKPDFSDGKLTEDSSSLKRKLAETKGKSEAKIRKFNVNDALSIKQEEDGVMYVTVRGEKPNELLLVKVKKMDKPEKSKAGKKSSDAKDKDNLFIDRNLEQKGQIIEHQIEQYKKKREKVLGPKAVTEIIPENKIKKENNDTMEGRDDVVHDLPQSPVRLKEFSEIKKEKSPKPQRCKDKKMPVDVKVYTNAEDYNNRIETVKSKLEDKQRKDWEEVNPGTECPIDRLKRILPDVSKEENLNEFIDNLQQRKMILTKLSDEDIVTLFQERLLAKVKEAKEEVDPLELEVPFTESYECDFCFSEFPTKDVCDEHMKFHDSKIHYLCEDCNEEFTILRYKKNHNVICIRKLICKYCDLMLDSKGKKKQHEQKHCDSLFGQLCEYCGEKFKHQGTLDQHVKSKHMTLEKTFQCPKCPKKFTFKTKLSFHLKSVHTAMRAYLCEDCGADFKNPASLRHHRIRKHLPTGNKRECLVCRKMIPFYSLSKHMHTHKAYTIKCPHCDKMFKNSSTLKQHVRIHEDQRQFRCDTCGVGFNRRDGLRLHMKVHEKADSRGLKECSCQVCGEKFPNHSMLVIHRNRIHKDGRNFTCHICNRSMISTRSLEWHLAHIHNEPLPGIVKAEMITGSDSKRVACFHCHKTFKTEMILRTHIKNSHMEKEPVKCLDCDETFVSEVRLRHHMMVAHNRLEGTLACPHCPKRFVNQLRLKTHMIAHSEERPFRCDICGFNLKTKIQLIKHHQNRHSDERPLQCRYCPWRCKQVSALVCHERTHTNERPYSCSVCRQRFKYLGDKNKHERRHESLGGSGFKRIVTNRGPKKLKSRKDDEDTSNSEQEQEMLEEQMEEQIEEPMEEHEMEEDEMETIDMEARLVDAAYEAEDSVKIEATVIGNEDEYADYQEDYEESSKDATEVIMNMEDTAVYTEEVTAENIESIETTQIIEDEMMANQLLQSGTVVHIEQHDEEGKIQMIPVVLSLPDLTEENSEVNLATTSIMYNNDEE